MRTAAWPCLLAVRASLTRSLVTEARYHDGTYLADHPDWHAADAPWKARWIAGIISRNAIEPAHITEVGSGSGAVLENLLPLLPETLFAGCEISPQAHALAQARVQDRLAFHLRDALADGLPRQTDLVMAIDVLEHVEDCFGFTRQLTTMAEWKVLHIPLDLSVQGLLRNRSLMHARQRLGHLHYFCRDTALAFIAECGMEVVDWHYTHGAETLPDRRLRTRLLNGPRRLLRAFDEDFSVRLLGGASMLVLAR